MKTYKCCPICGSNKLSNLDGFDIKPGPEVFEFLGLSKKKSIWNICKKCAFLFQNPRPDPEAVLSLYQTGLYRQNRKYSELFFQNRYDRPILHLNWAKRKIGFSSDAFVLDIGGGFGGAVRAFMDKGLKAEGVELDPNLCMQAKKRFNVELINSDIMECDFPVEKFGMIYSAHVHEHFDDFQRVNEKLLSWLKPGGYLLCVLPTYRFAGKNGQGFINVFHNSIFTKTSLYNMFVKCGLAPIAFHYPLWLSSAEIWAVARKKRSQMQEQESPVKLLRDKWRIVEKEIKYAPFLFQGINNLRSIASKTVNHMIS